MQVKLLSLIGDVVRKDFEPQVHVHLVVGTIGRQCTMTDIY